MEEKLIAVIGGTGKSGKYLVKNLLSKGYYFRLLVRDPNNIGIQNPLIEIVQGNVSDYEAIRLFTQSCHGVISTLGMGLPPGKPTIFSTSTRHVLQAMAENQFLRYIVTTGVNVDTPFDNKGTYGRSATDWMKANYPKSTQDRQTEYDLLAASQVDWTLVRLPLIDLKDEGGEVSVSLEDCPGPKISATSLAEFLIGQLSDKRYVRKAPFAADSLSEH